MFDIDAVSAALVAAADAKNLDPAPLECDVVVQINGLRVGCPVSSLGGMRPEEAASAILGAWMAQAAKMHLLN